LLKKHSNNESFFDNLVRRDTLNIIIDLKITNARIISPAHNITSTGILGGDGAAVLQKFRLGLRQPGSGFLLRMNTPQGGDEIKRDVRHHLYQTPGFSNRFSMIFINDLLTVFPSLK